MQHPKMKHLYCGVDTHKKTHTAVLINCFGEKLNEITFENKVSGFERLYAAVNKHITKGISIIYGLEDTGFTGKYLAEYLLVKKELVKKVDSSLTYSERRNTPITHKTDSFDALCIARVLVNKLEELPDASIDELYATLKSIVYRRKAIIKSRAAIKNQLHVIIMRNYPSYSEFFSETYLKSAMKFWEKYPSPSHLVGVTANELGEFLKKHSHKTLGIKKAELILSKALSEYKPANQYQAYSDSLVKHCIDEINHMDKQISKLEEQMKELLSLLPYKLETLPGIDLVSAASIIAEIGDISRFKNANKLSKYSGISPITYSSGSKERNFRNRHGNRLLYNLIHEFAVRSILPGRNKNTPVNELFMEYHAKKISEGKTDHQAIICVMRRLITIIFGMLKHKREYCKPEFVKKAKDVIDAKNNKNIKNNGLKC